MREKIGQKSADVGRDLVKTQLLIQNVNKKISQLKARFARF